ncbi:rhamnogalacturonan acetylesterase [Rufibacter sp. LB8]|uniref:rhamnogalacturonan acetylesterase n=1 Tax=Rufibacter sp. LB8 TaxID=2777781 RepID=UPI00178C367F|nr:rhamnogalacturonan acetylesterase [Rufibacter sp. LB8]
MNRILIACSVLFVLAVGMAFVPRQQQKKITVYLIGDSTISIKEKKAYPETGWGMPFTAFFDETVTIANHARNGRSTRTFLEENRWKPIQDSLQSGDYVFIQFGHNDASVEKPERYTSPADYRQNLIKFVTETRAKKALPVLVTPVSRRKFNKEGQAQETHALYSKEVKAVAQELNVPLIDLDTKSRALYQEFGPENSKLLFLQLKPGQHPNYPDGKEDGTHFNELGARLVAQLVLAEIKALNLELAQRIIKREAK